MFSFIISWYWFYLFHSWLTACLNVFWTTFDTTDNLHYGDSDPILICYLTITQGLILHEVSLEDTVSAVHLSWSLITSGSLLSSSFEKIMFLKTSWNVKLYTSKSLTEFKSQKTQCNIRRIPSLTKIWQLIFSWLHSSLDIMWLSVNLYKMDVKAWSNSLVIILYNFFYKLR